MSALAGFDPVEWAISRGLPIIPLRPNKKPLIPSWKPYQARPPKPEEISRWKKDKRRPAWAIVTGACSGRITLDFDGAAGTATMRTLGIEPHRQSPSEGFHADFAHPGWHVPTNNGKSKRDLGARYPGLDIRGDGGYIVIEGRTAKGSYVWLRDPEPYPLDILPTDLRELLGLLRPPPHPNGSGRVNADFLIRRALERVNNREGRNDAGMWLACQLRDNGYDQTEAAAVMHSYRGRCPNTNSKGEREPYTEAEILATLRESYRRPPRPPWNKPSVPTRPEVPSEIGPAVPRGFRLDETGLYKIRQGESPLWICDQIEVLAHARSIDGENWSKQLRFRDREGLLHQLLLPVAMLAKDKGDVCAKLLSLGLKISAHKDASRHLREYIHTAEPQRTPEQ